ncbi:Uncharacterized protein BM_BM17914 [Brugia malayi]|uniref:Uncharacterized protein n=1 Tax=Brugia malayi TaxID=6279 RepID=A0A4E9EQA3_BRUMA|nr:Uncharacterized protein BM_BM17914 [Brugia malayi]VIO86371.1 Uncharacterized protein BM_BM17914 [Brugia malayi]
MRQADKVITSGSIFKIVSDKFSGNAFLDDLSYYIFSDVIIEMLRNHFVKNPLRPPPAILAFFQSHLFIVKRKQKTNQELQDTHKVFIEIWHY